MKNISGLSSNNFGCFSCKIEKIRDFPNNIGKTNFRVATVEKDAEDILWIDKNPVNEMQYPQLHKVGLVDIANIMHDLNCCGLLYVTSGQTMFFEYM